MFWQGNISGEKISMMKKYQFVFEANVLIDVALQSGDHHLIVADLLKLTRSGNVEGWTTVTVVTMVVHAVERAMLQDGVVDPKTKAYKVVRSLLKGVHLLPVPGLMSVELLEQEPQDYDQALLLRAAKNYLPDPVIITRDKSFPPEPCTVLHPKDTQSWMEKDASSSGGNIAFIDLAQQQRNIFPALEQAVFKVFSHGKYIMGPEIQELESRLKEFAGVKHVVTCSSGTDALLMGLMAYDIGPGDAVFTTAFTFIATAEVISILGATPVFVDIDQHTFNIDPIKLEEAVQKVEQEGKLTARGVIPVDLFGLPADYGAIGVIAEKYSLFVLEDAAQGLGGVYKGKKAGTLGHAAAVSFFPAKPLGCYGDGGALFTDDDELAEKFNSLRFHGKGSEKYDNVRIGVNARLDTLQAAILLPKLAVFPEELVARQQVADRYEKGLKDLVETPKVPKTSTSAWAQYSILSDNRNGIQTGLKKMGIPSGIYYPRPLHLQTAFRHLGYKEGDFPVAEMASNRVLSLPVHHFLKVMDIDKVIQCIRKSLNC